VEAIERLVAIEQITRLKAAYFRYMDTKDWQAFADQFTADATMDVSGEAGGGVIEGRREIASFVRNALRRHVRETPRSVAHQDDQAHAAAGRRDMTVRG